MNLKDLKISTLLKIGLASLLFFVILLGIIAYIQSSRIQQQVSDIYNHPLKVQRAIGSLEIEIKDMFINLRDLVLSENEKDKNSAILQIDYSNAKVHKLFDIIYERYLGPKLDIDEAYKAYCQWKSMYDIQLSLLSSGQIDSVKNNILPNGKLGMLREHMMARVQIIDNFAINKGDTLYADSIRTNDALNTRLFLIIAIIISLSLIINFTLISVIRKPIEELTNTARRFHAGDMNARSSNESKSEFGELSSSFNILADSIQFNSELTTKVSNIAGLMLTEDDAKRFFQITLDALCTYTSSQMAAAYLLSDDKKNFELFESIGLDSNAKQSFSIQSFEGEFGPVISSLKVQHIKNITNDTQFVFSTVSCKFIPREIITIPILSGKEVTAIISLASLNNYSELSVHLIEKIRDTFNARIEGVLAFSKIKVFSEKLEKVNSYTRGLIEASIDPFVTIGPDGKITDVNNATEEITGLTRLDLIGTDFANYFTEPEQAKLGYQKVFKDGFIKDYDLAIRHISGKITPVLYNATVYRNELGQVAGVFAAARDITEQKRNEQEMAKLNQSLITQSENLSAANRELETQKMELSSQSLELIEQNTELEMQKKQLGEASRLKTNFLSNMSHELRTPLNSVIALSGVLNRRLENKIPADEYSYIEVIERNGKNLLSLINDILDISRIEAGREEVEITKFNMNSLISDVVAMIKPQAERKKINLIHVEKDLNITISNDSKKCEHILQNLIANAVKFTEKGKVEITTHLRKKHVLITVTDTGIGIDEKHIPHIFDEFRQADGSTSRKFGGTGLGLAIAKKYAHLLGGNITVKSTIGKGSEFTLKLPTIYTEENRIIEDDNALFLKYPVKPAPDKAITSSNAKTILLVEDSEVSIIQMKDILEENGYQLIIAHNGAEALELISKIIPEAMILDLMMPGIDGFEVLKTIRNADATAHIPVLILTAKHINREELKFLKRNNIHELIQKGDISREELLSAVYSMVHPKLAEKAKPEQISQSTNKKPKVLVVEDNADNMLTVRALLANRFELIEAINGNEGVEMAKKHLPNLILMDISLPETNGIEVFKTIRSNPQLQHIPIIALTASAMVSDRETILAHGFNGYIPKPIDEELFFQTINQTLYGK